MASNRGRRTTMRTLPLLIIALGLAACSGDFCTKNYDKRKECASADQLGRLPEKSEYVKKCQEEEKKAKDDGSFDAEYQKAQMACFEKSDCEAVVKCASEVADKQYTKKQVKEIEEAGKGDDIEKMKDACQYVDEDKAELVTACKPIMVKLVAASTTEVTKMRDEGKHDYSACGDLERFAKTVGSDEEAKAKVLCSESQASENVAKALSESAANVTAKKADMPYECGAALKELGEIDTEWAKGKKSEVTKACFEDLGLVIMEVKVPGMQYVCDFRVKEIYKAVKEHNIENEKMKEWMAKADKLCAKEG